MHAALCIFMVCAPDSLVHFTPCLSNHVSSLTDPSKHVGLFTTAILPMSLKKHYNILSSLYTLPPCLTTASFLPPHYTILHHRLSVLCNSAYLSIIIVILYRIVTVYTPIISCQLLWYPNLSPGSHHVLNVACRA